MHRTAANTHLKTPHPTTVQVKCGLFPDVGEPQAYSKRYGPNASFDLAKMPSLAARYLEKKTRRFLDFFAPPPRPVSPGSPEVDPMIDQNKRNG